MTDSTVQPSVQFEFDLLRLTFVAQFVDWDADSEEFTWDGVADVPARFFGKTRALVFDFDRDEIQRPDWPDWVAGLYARAKAADV